MEIEYINVIYFPSLQEAIIGIDNYRVMGKVGPNRLPMLKHVTVYRIAIKSSNISDPISQANIFQEHLRQSSSNTSPPTTGKYNMSRRETEMFLICGPPFCTGVTVLAAMQVPIYIRQSH